MPVTELAGKRHTPLIEEYAGSVVCRNCVWSTNKGVWMVEMWAILVILGRKRLRGELAIFKGLK